MTAPERELVSLIKQLRARYPDASPAAAAGPSSPIDPGEPILGEFVRSMLMWEAATPAAAAALRRLEAAVVDFNELRICLPDELVRIMGDRYPRAQERALRIRAALTDIYTRQHAVTLEHLRDRPKREARDYLESLEGVPRCAAARVCLVCLGVHAAPVDSRVAHRLQEAGVVEPGASPDDAAAALERRIRSGELAEAVALLQAWADDLGDAPAEGGPAPFRPKARGTVRAQPVRTGNGDGALGKRHPRKTEPRAARPKPDPGAE